MADKRGRVIVCDNGTGVRRSFLCVSSIFIGIVALTVSALSIYSLSNAVLLETTFLPTFFPPW